MVTRQIGPTKRRACRLGAERKPVPAYLCKRESTAPDAFLPAESRSRPQGSSTGSERILCCFGPGQSRRTQDWPKPGPNRAQTWPKPGKAPFTEAQRRREAEQAPRDGFDHADRRSHAAGHKGRRPGPEGFLIISAQVKAGRRKTGPNLAQTWRGSIQGGPAQKGGRTSPEGWVPPC